MVSSGRRFPQSPLEFYGESIFSDNPPPANEICPFLREIGIEARCTKTRKSERDEAGRLVTIGTCTAGQGGQPVIISPPRMLQGRHIFRDAAGNLTSTTWDVVPEVSTPKGSIDYVLVGLDASGRPAGDYVGLEVQTMDTTGSMYQAKLDWYSEGRLKRSYKYGMNWAHIAKLILVQSFNKAPLFAASGSKYIWAIQDALLSYMRSNYDLSAFHKDGPGDVFALYSYQLLIQSDNEFRLEPGERIGTDLDGLARTLRHEQGGIDMPGLVLDAYNRSQRIIRLRGAALNPTRLA